MAASSDEICLHYKFGYCKHKTLCHKIHLEEICESEECNQSQCNKRHPPLCKFFCVSSRCKFRDSCAYIHKNPVLEELQVLKENVRELEKRR